VLNKPKASSPLACRRHFLCHDNVIRFCTPVCGINVSHIIRLRVC